MQPFPDGIDWLKKKGYKTVLHLRQPGENNSAARRMYEMKGFRYVSLEASPARIDRVLVDTFIRLVEDTKDQPLFIYDKDGSLTGGLWYLYYRLHAKATPEKALEEATRLGLKKDDDVEHRTMWIAVQKLLEKE